MIAVLLAMLAQEAAAPVLENPDTVTRLLIGMAGGTPLAGVLTTGIIWLARRDTARNKTDREDRGLLIAALESSKTAVVEVRRALETMGHVNAALEREIGALKNEVGHLKAEIARWKERV